MSRPQTTVMPQPQTTEVGETTRGMPQTTVRRVKVREQSTGRPRWGPMEQLSLMWRRLRTVLRTPHWAGRPWVSKGNELVRQAGSVAKAAESLWQVREDRGLMNLEGIDNEEFDGILHPDLLQYLRAIRKEGMPARYVGSRHRVKAKLHPNAKRNVDQVYRQVAKDVKKHRALVVDGDLKELGTTVSSPFEAVDKLLPDRSISKEKRIVHDQRTINKGTSKFWHPPALQPMHVQVARRVMWMKARFPGVPILMSKKDIAGAFRLIWVAPPDVELFAGRSSLAA